MRRAEACKKQKTKKNETQTKVRMAYTHSTECLTEKRGLDGNDLLHE